jgi:hypothetical protein
MGIPYKNAELAAQGQQQAGTNATAGANAGLARDKYTSGTILGGGLGAAQAGAYWGQKNAKAGEETPDTATSERDPTTGQYPATDEQNKNWDT